MDEPAHLSVKLPGHLWVKLQDHLLKSFHCTTPDAVVRKWGVILMRSQRESRAGGSLGSPSWPRDPSWPFSGQCGRWLSVGSVATWLRLESWLSHSRQVAKPCHTVVSLLEHQGYWCPSHACEYQTRECKPTRAYHGQGSHGAAFQHRSVDQRTSNGV